MNDAPEEPRIEPVEAGFRAHLLLVDDLDENLQMGSLLLRSSGYVVDIARNGKEALAECAAKRPDLILLDVMMPTMDGYECCQRLKADPDLRDIPVIFLTAIAETEEVVKGLELGAVDHVGKPFNAAELLARVSTHLRLRQLQTTVEDNYRRLSELEALRDNLVHMIIHDLRTPLSVVQGNIDLVEMLGGRGDKFDDLAGPLRDAKQATVEVIHMVSNLLDISRLEEGRMPLNLATVDMSEMLDRCGRKMRVKARQSDIDLKVEADPAEISCDSELIERVLVNLVANAIKFSFPDTSVRLSADATPESLTVRIDDSGPGVPKAYQAKVFEKFGQVEAYENRKKFSTGLGLTFCKLAVEAHGGRIGVESDGESGSRFWFTLPKQARN